MSGYGPDGTPVREKDPLVKFLLGCALVVGTLAVLVIGGCGVFAWRLMRDETPGRPVEAILAGDESRYWCFDLKPDDAGLVALVGRFDAVNEQTRRRALENSPLRGFPIPTRRMNVDEILPLKLELAASTSGDGDLPADLEGWAGRATLSRGGLRLRAGMKLMRWMFTRDASKAEVVDVDGVQVTLLHDGRLNVAIASVGNRVLVADGVERLRSLLAAPAETTPDRLAGIPELHDATRLPGEDGWAFAADVRVPGPTRPLPLLGAVASFDVAPEDELRVRIVVPKGDGAGLAALSPEEALAIARSFLPRVSEGLALDPATPADDGRVWRIEGRISDLSSRFSSLLSESPSATPTDPSPPPTSDPRSDTPAAPTRGGTPTPAG